MKNFKLNRDDCLFLFVDLQGKILKAIHNNENVLKNSVILAKVSEILNMPTILTAQYPKGLGSNEEVLRKHLKDSKEYGKLSFDCYGDKEIKEAIDSVGKKQIIVCGIESHICVYQTVRSLLGGGYQVFLPMDALGSRKEENHFNALKNLDQMGAVVTNTETILFDLAGIAGTEEFKTLQKLIL